MTAAKDQALAPVRVSTPHDSAPKHVSGQAVYVDDMAEPPGLVHAYVALSPHAHARIRSIDLGAVAAAPGVAAVMAAKDIPGVNDVGPAFMGDPIFADGLVEYHGQSIFAVAATSMALAREAASKAVIAWEILPPILTIDDALAAQTFVLPTQVMQRGDADSALATAPMRLSGRIDIGGQEHFYLEGQVAMAIPGEDGDLLVHSSTQHPTEVQHLVARALKLSDNQVVCETRRMGGGFGGKESQASLIAVVAALLAQRTGRPVKHRLDRDDDMILTGKRHHARIDYDVGFDKDGRIQGIRFVQSIGCGYSPDLSGAIADRAMFHADNAYYFPHVHIVSHRCKTNTVSNTAFRGFGGPQGMVGIEHAVDEIARHLRIDPLTVRKRNFYGKRDRNITPYHMRIEDNIIADIVAELERDAGYASRRRQVATFNAENRWVKRGLALTPVKFGISFTLPHMNQAGALVHVYTDGSVQLNHGGTEMGQGLYLKVAQIVAAEFGIGLDRVKITATTTAKVPNTSPTAASSGTDLNGKAAQAAARTIRQRMATVAATAFGVPAASVAFADGKVSGGGQELSFGEVAKLAHRSRVSLSSTGYYRTPKIHYDSKTHRGRPFYYFAYGAAVAEVEVDTLTGEYRLRRVDILHDAGESLNPAIDLGQVEGGFVQGMGWLTTEELWWDEQGHLQTHAPSTYKIPACGDVPAAFNVTLFKAGRNREDAIYRSKAVGEPPLMLGIAVFQALRDAIAACGDGWTLPRLDAPATPERVLLAIEAQRAAPVVAAPVVAAPVVAAPAVAAEAAQ
jgi:xanthine dehydrogenase large subunit